MDKWKLDTKSFMENERTNTLNREVEYEIIYNFKNILYHIFSLRTRRYFLKREIQIYKEQQKLKLIIVI